MSQKGVTGVNHTGSISQDVGMSPCKGKRDRDQNEEDMHHVASGMADHCVKARDQDLTSDILPSGGNGNGTDNHIFTTSEKRIKCGPSDTECDTQISTPGMNVDQVATSGIEGASEFFCDICNVKSTSAKDLETHLSGKKHAKRMELASSIATSDYVRGSSITKGSGGGSKAKVFTPQKIQASIENGSAHLNANMAIISMGQQVLVDTLNDNASQAFNGHISSCAGGTDVEVEDFQASLSKCPDLNDANAVAVGQQASIDCPFMEPVVNHVSKNDSSSRAGGTDVEVVDFQASLSKYPDLNDANAVAMGVVDFQASLSKYPDLNDANAVAMGQQASIDGPSMEPVVNHVSKNDSSSRAAVNDDPVANGTVHNPTLNDANAVAVEQQASIDGPGTELVVNQVAKNDSSSRAALDDGPVANGDPTPADDFPKESSKRVIFEDQPVKSFLASLSPKSNSDCVTRALASALSAYTCPGLEDLHEGNCCSQAAGCSDSQTAGAVSPDSNSMVNMHAHCFLNLLHDVRVSVIEDLVRCAVGEERTWGPEQTWPPGAALTSAVNRLHDVRLSAVEDTFRRMWGEERNGGLIVKTWLPSAASISALAPDGETAGLNCTVCRVEYGSKADLELHLAGKRHTSLVRRLGSRCQLCNVNCNSEKELEIHINGRKHASRLRLIQKRVTF